MGDRVLWLYDSVQIEHIFLICRLVKITYQFYIFIPMDFDPTHYSMEEMKLLLGLDVLTEESLRQAVEREMAKHPDNEEILSFYQGIQSSLLATLQRNVNPDVKNIITRILHIDSSHLPSYADTTTTDKFTFTLSDQINNVISLTLVSLELPQSWYTFTFAKGTTCFVYYKQTVDVSSNKVYVAYTYRLEDGNYSVSSLLKAIKDKVTVDDDTFNYTLHVPSGKVKFTSEFPFKIMWHDTAMINSELSTTYANYHLGILVGFPQVVSESIPVLGTETYAVEATTPVHVSGTRYVTLELNDYSSNRISNNIVLMNSLPRIKVYAPEYYRSDTPQVRVGPTTTLVLPSASDSTRTLTQTQATNINSIIAPAPSGRLLIARQASNLFAKIPLKRNNYVTVSNGTDDVCEKGYAPPISEFAGSIQTNTREYFGPITLTNIEVALYDDRGLLLGLNGMNWSCSIIVRSVYQKNV